MISFIFSVLGSVIFWLLFFVVGLFVGSLLLKHLAPKTFSYCILGEKDAYGYYSDDKCSIPFIFFAVFVLWPITLAITIIAFIIGKILWPLFCQGVKKSVSIIPDIEIKKKAPENSNETQT